MHFNVLIFANLERNITCTQSWHPRKLNALAICSFSFDIRAFCFYCSSHFSAGGTDLSPLKDISVPPDLGSSEMMAGIFALKFTFELQGLIHTYAFLNNTVPFP